MLIWTDANRPFADEHTRSPVGIEVSNKRLGKKIPLGRGFFGHVISSPVTGETIVIEAGTGAIVGSELSKVQAEIQECQDIETLRQRIAKGEEHKLNVVKMSEDEFWNKFSRVTD